MNIEGILPILKPAGWTSHDVVAKTRGILRMKRIGHTGTLDPQVTGVLPLCIGRATRAVEYLQELPKEYIAVLRLGLSTDTQDMTGQILRELTEVHIDFPSLERAIAAHVGTIEQVPPMYSAVKVEGKKLYELARRGEVVERKARQVTIYEIELLSWKLDSPRPDIRMRVLCSKGTYIRTLCEDIGNALGVPSVMAELVRSRSGYISLDDCLTLEEVRQLHESGELAGRIIPVDEGLKHLPRGDVPNSWDEAARNGRPLPADILGEQPTAGPLGAAGNKLRLYDSGGMFLGIYSRDEELGRLKPDKLFQRHDDSRGG